MTTSSNGQPTHRHRRPKARNVWLDDQAIAILREVGQPMTARQVADRYPYTRIWGGHPGDDNAPCEECVPVSEAETAHVHVRGHTTSAASSESLRRLHTAGVVTREKVDRLLYWSLSEEYLADLRQTTTQAAAILARADLDAGEINIEEAPKVDGPLGLDFFLDDDELRVLVGQKLAALVAAGVVPDWTQRPYCFKNGDDDWTAVVEWNANGPMEVTSIRIWEGATPHRQFCALTHALRVVSNPKMREKFALGCVIR